MAREVQNATATPTVRVTERLQDLLTKTSRTFALNIPLLEEPTRCEVTVAYLLFRVADTLEDSVDWSGPRKLDELERFASLLREPGADRATQLAEHWLLDPPCDHDGYMELLTELPLVMETLSRLAPASQRVIVEHTLRTIEGMGSFIARGKESELRLRDIDELKDYCYAVAGIVGEMLTELFIARRTGLESSATELRQLAPAFGEALQLVNILKDSASDSGEGRHFLPADHDLGQVYELAREDMRQAARYVACLDRAGAPRGIVAFTALPLLLAGATIDRVQQQGPGSRITRDDVTRIVSDLHRALDRGTVPALFNRF
jgi:farnesyl-diphosphate farnesyltransferase